jgi:hypothetical protein
LVPVHQHVDGKLRRANGGIKDQSAAYVAQVVGSCVAVYYIAETAIGGDVVIPKPCRAAHVTTTRSDADRERDAQSVAGAEAGRRDRSVHGAQNGVVKSAAATGQVIDLTRTYQRSILEYLCQQVKLSADIVAVLQSEPNVTVNRSALTVKVVVAWLLFP